ncbi:MAG: acylphosphatase [Methanobacterium sp.]|nr:acylphosphatase [Methanobacterium sp.]
MKVRAHVIISGRVQGVYFRGNTKNEAKKYGVNGWVRNLPDGRVEAVFEVEENQGFSEPQKSKIFEGEKEAVDKAIKFVKKGPSYAKVTDLDIKWEKYTGEFNDFRVLY